MGILNIFKQRKAEPAAKEPLEIKKDDIPDWFRENFSGRIERKKLDADRMYTDIKNSFSRIRDSVSVLENATLDEDRDRTMVAASMAKKSFVTRVNALVNSLQKLPDMDYAVLSDFYSSTKKTVADIKGASPKQAFLLSRFFGKQSNSVISNIKEADGALDALKQFLDTDARILRLSHDIESNMKKHSELSEKLKALENRENGLSGKMDDIRKGMEEDRKRLGSLSSDPEWKNLNMINEEIGKTKLKAQEIKQEIVGDISVIKRPLKKLEHLANTGYQIRKERGDLLRVFMSTPFEGIMKNRGELDLKELITETNDMIKLKKLTLKPREREKMLEVMRKLETQIPWLKDKYEKLVKQAEDLKKKREETAPGLVKEMESLEDSIKNGERELGILESELKEISNGRGRLKEELVSAKAELEKLISENTEYSVKLED